MSQHEMLLLSSHAGQVVAITHTVKQTPQLLRSESDTAQAACDKLFWVLRDKRITFISKAHLEIRRQLAVAAWGMGPYLFLILVAL